MHLAETGVDLVVTSLGEAVERVVAEARATAGAPDQPPTSTIPAASAAE